eukprot:719693-Prorocentrum_minimum.AAC.1
MNCLTATSPSTTSPLSPNITLFAEAYPQDKSEWAPNTTLFTTPYSTPVLHTSLHGSKQTCTVETIVHFARHHHELLLPSRLLHLYRQHHGRRGIPTTPRPPKHTRKII